MQTGMLRLVDPEAMLINFERADLRFERRSRDPESRRRTRRARYAAFARGERRLDSRSLVGCQFVIQRRSNIRSTTRSRTSQRSSMLRVLVSDTITARSMTFCNSRMLPGHG